MQGELVFAVPGLGQQLDGVAQFLGVANIGVLNVGNAPAWDGGDGHCDAEGDLGQNRQLVGGIDAVDVEGRIGLGIAAPLSLGQCLRIGLALFAHAGEDEIAGAVENALHRQDLVGGQALGQSGDDRDAAADRRLEGHSAVVTATHIEHFRAMLCQQGFVGGDDMFAVGQRVQDGLFRVVGAADDFHDDLNAWVFEDVTQVGGQDAGGQGNSAWLGGILHDDAAQLQAFAGACGQAFRVFQEQLGNAAADIAATNQTDTKCFHGFDFSNAFRAKQAGSLPNLAFQT